MKLPCQFKLPIQKEPQSWTFLDVDPVVQWEMHIMILLHNTSATIQKRKKIYHSISILTLFQLKVSTAKTSTYFCRWNATGENTIAGK